MLFVGRWIVALESSPIQALYPRRWHISEATSAGVVRCAGQSSLPKYSPPLPRKCESVAFWSDECGSFT